MGQQGVEKRAVKLVELGPRMKLRLTKVEEEVCGGKVMWHEYLEKSSEEIKEMESMWEQRRSDKAERKRVQKENIERKREESGQQGKNEKRQTTGEEMDEEEDWDSEGLEDDAEMGMNGEETEVPVG